MKILYIGHIRIPTEKAHGFQIMKMCEAFAVNGHNVELIVPERKNFILGDPFEYYGVSERENFSLQKVNVGSYNLYVGPKLFVSIKNMFYSFRFLLSLHRIHFELGTLVYTRNATIAFWCGIFRPRTQVVYEAHGVPRRFCIQKFLLRRVSVVVAITNGIVEDYRERGYKGRMIVEADAFDPQVFEEMKDKKFLREELGIPISVPVAVYTGSFSLYAWKGVDILISAVSALPKEVLVVLVGGSFDEIVALSSRIPEGRIKLVPRVSRAVVAKYLCAADILVLPNTKGDIMSERHTSPLKLFEYMASGTPIVASSLPSIREVLNETNSILVEPNNPTDLARGIEEVIRNPDSASARAKRAKEQVRFHTWSLRAKRIIDVLQ